MLNWLISRKLNDKDFGRLEYKTYIFHDNFWKGRLYFPPTGANVDIYIASNKNGISDTQRKFYKDLLEKYESSPERFYKNLLDAFEFHHGKELTDEIINVERIEEEFALERIYIPNFDKSDEFWELSYKYKNWNQSYTLFFNEWKYMCGSYDD